MPISEELTELANRVGARLKERGETVAVAENSAGGLVSAALLAVPGASAYFVGGAVPLLPPCRRRRFWACRIARRPNRARRPSRTRWMLANTIRERLSTTWGLAETGTRPVRPAIATAMPRATPAWPRGPSERATTLKTGSGNRAANMDALACAGLRLFLEALGG